MRLAAYSCFPVLLLSTALSMAGPIYTWQDEQGRIHFSDRPVDAAPDSPEIRQIDLDTQIPGSQQQVQPPADNIYSIRNQIEYFDRKREAERQAWLEEQKLKQAARAQELHAQQLEQQAEQEEQPETVIVNPSPYYYPYRPYYRHPYYHPHKHGGKNQGTTTQQSQDQGDPTVKNLNVGNPYPNSPFYRWNY